MNRILCMFGCMLLLSCPVMGQMLIQSDSSVYTTRRIIPIDKANLLKNIDLVFNMQFANNSDFIDGQYQGSNYALNQFRLEIRGQITDNIFFRFRDRYTREAIPEPTDNVDYSVDMAYIGVNLSKKWAIAVGKQSADYGGYEFLVNPIYIYQYNDIIAHSSAFQAGAQVSWHPVTDHQFTLQLLNARNTTFADMYGTVPGVTPDKFDFCAVGNWNGNFLKGKFSTFWSYSIIKEAQV